jgi:hypothetical protein
METLDLHGVRHHKVFRLVENFVLINSLPVKIITGNSTVMYNIVKNVVEEHGLRYAPENDWNLGALIIS